MRVHSKGIDWRPRAVLSPALASRPLHGSRSGLTLIELLAAMMVLMVGLYAVAALFPKLSRNIGAEETRTSIGRATQMVAQSYTSGTQPTPDAVAPLTANVDAVEPGDTPEDPDSTGLAENPLNSRDDFLVVYGEPFTVPPPAYQGEFPCYVPRNGLIDTASAPVVTELTALVETFRDPGATGTIRHGEYYLRPDGQIRFHSGTAFILLYYNWTDGTMVHRATSERVQNGQIVQGVRDYGGAVVPGYSRAYAVRYWNSTIGRPDAASLPTGSRNCVTDSRAGQALYFPPDAAGRELKIDYRVRRYSGRRELMMYEDHTLPTVQPYEIALNFGNIDDERPLQSDDQTGTALADDEFLLMVDLLDGTPIGYGGVTNDATFDFLRAIQEVDFPRGIITIDATALNSRLGHPVRIFYRTLDQHTIQVQKAPSEFVEIGSLGTSDTPDWEHRSFMISAAPVSAGGSYSCLYNFPSYCEDQAVQVEYLAGTAARPYLIENEIHIISDLGPGYGFGFVLNKADVRGVMSVRGASMRVVGWWRTESGRVGRLDVMNVLFPGG